MRRNVLVSVGSLRSLPIRLVRTVRARWLLRRCDSVGAFTQVIHGRPVIRNDGTLHVGRRVRLTCTEAPVALLAEAGATLRLGDSVSINYGTAVTAAESIAIGSNVSIGPYCIIADTDLAARPGSPDRGEIWIDDDVWLATRVVVLPGSRIGRGSVVTAGTVVSGEIPPGVVVGGAPARIIRRLEGTDITQADPSLAAAAQPTAPIPATVSYTHLTLPTSDLV